MSYITPPEEFILELNFVTNPGLGLKQISILIVKKQNLPLFVIKIMPNTIFCFYVRISLHSQFRVYLNLQIFIVYVNITNQIVSTKFIFIRIKILHIIWIIKTVEKVSNNKLLFLVAGLNVRTLKHIWTARLSALFRVTRLCIIKQT